MHRRALAVVLAAVVAAALAPVAARAVDGPPDCGARGKDVAESPLVVERSYEPGDARSYDYVEFTVPPGTTRVEVGYSWVDHATEQGLPSNPITDTLVPSVFDLGLWETTIADDSGFRGWSGSRQGRLHTGQEPVWVAEADAERGYLPGPIASGSWFAEIGVAAVGPAGATVRLEIACRSDLGAGTFVGDEVEADAVVDTADGPSERWYHGDFHLHAHHSNSCGPTYAGATTCGHPSVIEQAAAAGLDIVPITEYVTTQHWRELGAVEDEFSARGMLLWPGREIITYFGHAITLGETGVAEYRHGFTPPGEDTIDLGDVQTRIKDAGGLFGVAHPTIFPGPVFRSFCRGCEFELGGSIDWGRVDTIEVVTGPTLADLSDAHGSLPSTHTHGLSAQQPFIETAIDFWEERLLDGHKIAPVSGSDSKGVDGEDQRDRKGYGSSATAIFARELSRAAVTDAIEDGRVYVRTRGVDGSPELELTVRAGEETYDHAFGRRIEAATATMDVTVRGGHGQLLRVTRNGIPVAWLPIVGDEASLSIPIFRVAAEERSTSDLGTFWRVDTLDVRSLTTIGNAVFLSGE